MRFCFGWCQRWCWVLLQLRRRCPIRLDQPEVRIQLETGFDRRQIDVRDGPGTAVPGVDSHARRDPAIYALVKQWKLRRCAVRQALPLAKGA